MDSALFVLCLDHCAPANAKEMAENMLHGRCAQERERESAVRTCCTAGDNVVCVCVCV